MGQAEPSRIFWDNALVFLQGYPELCHNFFCQSQSEAQAKVMHGRLYIHTSNNNQYDYGRR